MPRVCSIAIENQGELRSPLVKTAGDCKHAFVDGTITFEVADIGPLSCHPYQLILILISQIMIE